MLFKNCWAQWTWAYLKKVLSDVRSEIHLVQHNIISTGQSVRATKNYSGLIAPWNNFLMGGITKRSLLLFPLFLIIILHKNANNSQIFPLLDLEKEKWWKARIVRRLLNQLMMKSWTRKCTFKIRDKLCTKNEVFH